MDHTITAIDTIALRIPLDIWAPAPMSSQGVPRTQVESLYVRVTTGRGVVGWGESFGTARPMVTAAFDHWLRRLAVGQSATDEELVPRIERMLMSLGRAGPMISALAGLDIALWDIRGKLAGVSISTLLGGAKRTHVECYASLLQYYGNPEHLKRNTARALERGYRHIKLMSERLRPSPSRGVLHCVAAKDKASPLERMFADFGATPFSKTVPVINGGIEVPHGPRRRSGGGAD